MEQEIEYKNTEPQEQEINFIELGKKLWDRRKFILKGMLWGMVAGVIIAISIPKEYNSTVTMAPELQSSSNSVSGGLSSLAAMAGINLKSASSTEALNPLLYPDIVNSVPFDVALFDVIVHTKDEPDQNMTLRDYLENHTRATWWSVIIKFPMKMLGKTVAAIKGEKDDDAGGPGYKTDPYQLTKTEESLLEAVRTLVGASVDDKTGVISVSVTMQDPVVAAIVADTVVSRLKAYVTTYRTDKARHDLEYAQKICEEARNDYYDAQSRYAAYADRNQNISTQSGRIKMQQLQNEASLAFDVYNTSAQQLQLAKAKVQEMAPVYTILQPARIPTQATMSKMTILLGFTFLGILIAGAWVLYGKDFFASFKKKEEKD